MVVWCVHNGLHSSILHDWNFCHLRLVYRENVHDVQWVLSVRAHAMLSTVSCSVWEIGVCVCVCSCVPSYLKSFTSDKVTLSEIKDTTIYENAAKCKRALWFIKITFLSCPWTPAATFSLLLAHCRDPSFTFRHILMGRTSTSLQDIEGAEHQESRLVFNDRPELVYLYEHGLLKAKFILIALCKLQQHH